MKISITIETASIEEACYLLARLETRKVIKGEVLDAELVQAPEAAAQAPEAAAPTVSTTEAHSHVEAAPRIRKPRSDAGKPRGAYGPRTESAALAGNGGATSTEKAPAERTGAANSEPAVAAAPTQRVPAPAAAPAPADQSDLTIEQVRAVMVDVARTPGLGMEANMELLKGHNVLRASDLPKSEYGAFISAAKARVALKGAK